MPLRVRQTSAILGGEADDVHVWKGRRLEGQVMDVALRDIFFRQDAGH